MEMRRIVVDGFLMKSQSRGMHWISKVLMLFSISVEIKLLDCVI
jgi:hypothetical protein